MSDLVMTEKTQNERVLQKGKLAFGSAVVAMATLFGYLMTYGYESGYAAYFGIPEQLVDVTLVSVLRCVGSLLFTFYILGAIINWILTRNFVKKHRVGLGLAMRLLTKSFVLLIFSLLASAPARAALPWMLGLSVLGLIYLDVIAPIRAHPEIKGWLNKIDEHRSLERERIERSKVMDALEKIFGFEMVFIFAVGFLLYWASPTVGKLNAASERGFGVASIDSKPHVLIRRYGDQYLFEKLSRNETRNLACGHVLTMTSGELAARRTAIQKIVMDPLVEVANCE